MPQTDLHRAVAAHRDLIERLKLGFPDETEETLADTIAGETQLDAAILTVLRAAIEREAFADTLGRMMDTMTVRQRRLAEGAQALRRAARDAMIEGGLPKLTAPDMTASVRDGKPKVLVTNPAAVPDDYCEFERKIHKREIGDALAAGKDVPGATLANGEPVLTVRRT